MPQVHNKPDLTPSELGRYNAKISAVWQHEGASTALASMPATSTADLAQQLSELNIARLNSQQNPSETRSSSAFVQQGQQQAVGAALSDMGGALNAHPAVANMAMPGEYNSPSLLAKQRRSQ